MKLARKYILNHKSFHSYIRSKKEKTKDVIAGLLRDSGGKLIVVRKLLLNDYFSSVFTREIVDCVPDTFSSNSTVFSGYIDFLMSYMPQMLGALKSNNIRLPAGPDGLNPVIFKECCDVLPAP